MRRQTLAFQVLDEGMEPVSRTYACPFMENSAGEWRNMNPIQVPVTAMPFLVRAHDEAELEEYWSEPLGRKMRDEEPLGSAIFLAGSLVLRMRV